jgi:LacI family transcriptional regulator
LTVYNILMKKLPKVALLIETSRTYGRELVRGIMRYSRTHGPWVFPWVYYRQDILYLSKYINYVEMEDVKKWHPDGIISRDFKGVEELENWNVPLFVAAGVTPPNTNRNNIVPDDHLIGIMAAEHFLERGFHNFGFCGFDDMHWSRQRCKSFCERISRSGFETNVYKQPISEINRTWYKEEKILVKWLKNLPKPIGIMACNDDRGQHITEACSSAKIKVPYEVAIIGVDNDEYICDTSNPPLSSVELEIEKAGFRACALLAKMMAGKKLPPQTITVPPIRVVTRQSTDFIATDDKAVSQAIQFIKQNARGNVQVNEVVKHSGISRRYLHQKFMKILGHTIYDEIRRVRINLICQMLLDTDLSIAEIAFELKYDSPSHISRYFKQKMRMSPLDYRKKYLHR